MNTTLFVAPATIHAATLIELHAVHVGLASWRRSRPAACCDGREAAPCRSCSGPSDDHPGEMSDSFRREYRLAVAREMTAEGLGFGEDRDPSEAELIARWERWRAGGDGDVARPPTLAGKVAAWAEYFLDDPDDDHRLIGEWLWAKKEEVEFLGARTAEEFADKHQAMLDAAADAAGSRWATNPVRW